MGMSSFRTVSLKVKKKCAGNHSALLFTNLLIKWCLQSKLLWCSLENILIFYWHISYFHLQKNYMFGTIIKYHGWSGKQKRLFFIVWPLLFEWNSWNTGITKIFSFRIFYNKFIAERQRVFRNLEICYYHYSPAITDETLHFQGLRDQTWKNIPNFNFLTIPKSKHHINVLLVYSDGASTEWKERTTLYSEVKMYNNISGGLSREERESQWVIFFIIGATCRVDPFWWY